MAVCLQKYMLIHQLLEASDFCGMYVCVSIVVFIWACPAFCCVLLLPGSWTLTFRFFFFFFFFKKKKKRILFRFQVPPLLTLPLTPSYSEPEITLFIYTSLYQIQQANCCNTPQSWTGQLCLHSPTPPNPRHQCNEIFTTALFRHEMNTVTKNNFQQVFYYSVGSPQIYFPANSSTGCNIRLPDCDTQHHLQIMRVGKEEGDLFIQVP